MVPLPLPRVIGVFERLTGNPAWRHFEQFAGGAYEGRAEVELVVRSIAQVGNYDYLLDWIFTQSGAMRVEVGADRHRCAEGGRPAGGARRDDSASARRWRPSWSRRSTATTSTSASTSTSTARATASCSAS